MFEVLMYLFENYMHMDTGTSLKIDEELIISELEQAGFHRLEIGRALDWLSGLDRVQKQVEASSNLTLFAMRHYSEEECEQLSVEARGFLLYLEQLSILDPITREIVIDRLMALDHRELSLSSIKWVVLIALFNQPEKKLALSLLQDIILTESYGNLH